MKKTRIWIVERIDADGDGEIIPGSNQDNREDAEEHMRLLKRLNPRVNYEVSFLIWERD